MGYSPITAELRSRGFDTSDEASVTCVFDKDTHTRLCDQIDAVHAALEIENTSMRARLVAAEADAKTQRNNFDQATSAREHWKRLYEAAQKECERLTESVRQLESERDEEHDRVNWLHAELKGLEDRSVELPLDADGEPWHIGDVTESGQTVSGMSLNRHGWSFVGIANEIDPAIHRHYVPDTWEHIIEDAVNVHGNGFNPCWTDERDALVARCRALAGEGQ